MATSTKGKSTGGRRQPAKKTTSPKRNTAAAKGRARTVTKNAQEFTVRDEVMLWTVLAVSVIILISNFGVGGFLGNMISSFFFGVFGSLAYLLPFGLFLLIAFIVSNKGNKIAWLKSSAFFLLWICFCAFIELAKNGYNIDKKFLDFYKLSSAQKNGGGFIGGLLCRPLGAALGVAGTYVVLVFLIIICIVLITERSLFAGMKKSGTRVYQTAKQDADILLLLNK